MLCNKEFVKIFNIYSEGGLNSPRGRDLNSSQVKNNDFDRLSRKLTNKKKVFERACLYPLGKNWRNSANLKMSDLESDDAGVEI